MVHELTEKEKAAFGGQQSYRNDIIFHDTVEIAQHEVIAVQDSLLCVRKKVLLFMRFWLHFMFPSVCLVEKFLAILSQNGVSETEETMDMVL